jgi:hypothetical protein
MVTLRIDLDDGDRGDCETLAFNSILTRLTAREGFGIKNIYFIIIHKFTRITDRSYMTGHTGVPVQHETLKQLAHVFNL